MPVQNPICQSEDSDKVSADHIHVCETPSSKLKFLDDRYPVTGQGVVSLGDVVQLASDELRTPAILVWGVAMIAALIKKLKPTS